MEIILTFAVVALALVLFITEWLPVDITALLIAVILIILNLVTPEQGISGFSNPATITVMSMFILSAGVSRTGVIQIVRDWLLKWGGKNPVQQIITMGLLVGPISGLINNTAVVAIFLPIVEDWSKKQGISVSKLLMPLSFSTILGGMITLLGTSTNILASGIYEQMGYPAIGIFQFTPLGIIIFILGLIYLAFVCPKLIPDRKPANSELVGDDYKLKDFVTEIIINPRSNLIGQTLRESGLQRKFDIDVLEIIHNGNHFPQPLADKKLTAGDILLIRGSSEELMSIKEERGVEILPEVKFSDLEAELSSGEEKVAEVLILYNSNLIGSTLKDLRFRQRYNATVLAIKRGQEIVRERLGKTSLKFGDLLLVQGPKESFLGLQTSRDLLVIDQRDVESLRQDKAVISLAIIIGVVLVSAFNWLPILVSSLTGVILMVITGCLKPGEIYGAVRWDVIFLLAGLIPLGIAMDESGTTEWLATTLTSMGGDLNGYWILCFFSLITTILTSILSNNASVVLMVPLSIEVAVTLGLNPYVFVLTVMFAASNCFMTPIGYQTNTMIYGPGGYKFLDFVRVGTPLNLFIAVITPFLVILFYGI